MQNYCWLCVLSLFLIQLAELFIQVGKNLCVCVCVSVGLNVPKRKFRFPGHHISWV